MNEVTRLLAAVQHGDAGAPEALLRRVYSELRQLARGKMARESPGHTLQATALVHEAWLRLDCGSAGNEQSFQNRAHFFGAAAEAMRRILIERARRKLAAKHGAGAEHVSADEIEIAAPTEKDDELLAVHESLDALAEREPQRAELVKLRYFAGLTLEQAADTLGIPHGTAKREWTVARAWLMREILRRRE